MDGTGICRTTESKKQGDFGEQMYFTLTDAGLGLSDYLGPKLISAEVNRAMCEWEAIHEQTHDSVSRKS